MLAGVPLALALGLHQLVLPHVFVAVPLRADSDTAVMLDAIRASGGLSGAWRWFVGDWFLENGFYRPITCLSLVLDYTLYGERAWGYRLTNWLLMVVTALGLMWAVRAFARQIGFPFADALASLSALMFSLQQTGLTSLFRGWSDWWFVVGLLLVVLLVYFAPLPTSPVNGGETQTPSPSTGRAGVGAAPSPRAGRAGVGAEDTQKLSCKGLPTKAWLWRLALAAGAMLWGFHRLMGTEYERLIGWVPSRTALLMTALSLWSLYCLLIGLQHRRWGCLLLALLLYLLALGAYEQAITLLPLLLGLILYQRGTSGRMGWVAGAGVLGATALIVGLRLMLIPLELSRYQHQQLRSSLSGPLWDYFSELIPPVRDWHYWQVALPEPSLWLFKEPWDHLVMLMAYAGVLVAFYRQWRLFGSLLLWQAITFLPMTFLHQFEHYHYLPQLGETTLDVALLLTAITIITERERSTAPPPSIR
jgi:hypothetical protein